jgi:2-oxo-3-hexenedioate decarboxylase
VTPPTAGITIDTAADTLYRAQTTATAVTQLSATGELDLTAAYRIQRTVADRRVASGERSTGFKMGFTSRAKMRQMGVDEVIGGLLSSSMAWADGDLVDPARLIHPRIEPEVVFRLGRDIDSAESVESAISAVDAVAAGLEVIDSRYANFTFSLTDVVADNASAAGYAVGPWAAPAADLANRGVLLEVDGAVAQTGSTAAILGDPWRAFAAAVRLSRQVGATLRAGDVILAGAATEAVPFTPGSSVRATVSGLGAVTLNLSENAS